MPDVPVSQFPPPSPGGSTASSQALPDDESGTNAVAGVVGTGETGKPAANASGQKSGTRGPWSPGTWLGHSSDNLDLLKALFFGLVVTAVVYEVFPLPFVDDRRIRIIFDNWVAEVIVGMTLWSLFILLYKMLWHRRQRIALQAFATGEAGGILRTGINARNVDAVLQGLRDKLGEMRIRHFEQTTIYRRVFRVLYYIRSVPQKEGINDLLDYQARIDVKKLDSSYSTLHVFIWAIPILGFIGTVLGIAAAVAEFSGFIQTAEGGVQFNAEMRGALAGVTSGLGVAFNTTLLALVLVIPVMLLTSFLQKTEEELLRTIEEYCLEELLPRLNFVAEWDPVAESFEQHLHRIQQLSSSWLGQFEPLVKSLTLQADMLRHQMSGVQPLIKDFTDRLLPSDASPQASQASAAGATVGSAPGSTPGEPTQQSVETRVRESQPLKASASPADTSA